MHLVERHLPVGSLSDLSALRTRLLRFARSRLRNAVLAEDAVSETLLAALETPRSFDTPTEALAWLYGVLRHKLVDQLRQQEREMPAGDRLLEAGAEADGGLMAGGGWAGGAGPADAPDEIVSQRELLAVVLQCCDLLPRLQGRAFLLRELRGLEPDAICRELGVTAGHLWVLIHRARQRLRVLVSARWPLPGPACALHVGHPAGSLPDGDPTAAGHADHRERISPLPAA